MAFRYLRALDQIKSFADFCRKHGFDRRNFARLQAEPQREFPVELLQILVTQYHISADYLLKNKGDMVDRSAEVRNIFVRYPVSSN